MENFSYPIKLEPLHRSPKPAPVKATVKTKDHRPQQIAVVSAPGAEKPAERRAKIRREHLMLRAQRERHGVTLKQIADKTRIPLRHLQELERGDVRNWPAGVYARSWARDYANEAGIDPDQVIAIVQPVAEVEPTIDEIKQVREEVERMRVDDSPLAPLVHLMRKFAAVIVALMIMALAAIYLWSRDPRPDDQPRPVGTSGVTQPGPATAGSSPQ